MGVSTDGVLFYGYVWDDELDLGFEYEWSTIVALKRGHLKRGHTDPWKAYPTFSHLEWLERDAAGHQWVKEHEAELDAWRAVRKAIEDEFGVDASYHGSNEWRCPYVFVKESRIQASRGYPEAIQPKDLNEKPLAYWDTFLKNFVEELEINLEEAKGPAWWLVSWWG